MTTAPKRFGSYELTSVIGTGRQSIVYEARDATGRRVALKVLGDPGDAAGAATKAAFEREAHIALNLSHRHIVRTHGAGEVDGQFFLACELVTGGSLRSLLREVGRLEEARALDYIRQVLLALEAIGAAGLVHRDVKPANLLLDDEGALKLSDLGFARTTAADRSLTDYTGTELFTGTPDYVSPEQIDADSDLDIRSDIYAAGIVLYECLAGFPPFVGATQVQTLNRHLRAEVPDVRSEAPDTRAEVAALIERFLAKDRADRPESASAALRLLEPLLAPGSTATRALAPRPGSGVLAVEEPRAPGGPLPRVGLVVGGGERPSTLFVYGGRRLDFGRDESAELDRVCLRVLPLSKRARSRSRKISRLHLALDVGADGSASIEDLGSTYGTDFDGRPLSARSPAPLPPRAAVSVAGVLGLEVEVVAPLDAKPLRIGDDGEALADVGSVWTTRPGNYGEHSYLLVPAAVALAVDDGVLRPSRTGSIDLLFDRGSLWLRDRARAPAACRPLAPGDSFAIGGVTVEVRPIERGDQKP